jgi:hypothetical protein
MCIFQYIVQGYQDDIDQLMDGTPYNQLGKTCYVWNHQGDAMAEQRGAGK